MGGPFLVQPKAKSYLYFFQPESNQVKARSVATERQRTQKQNIQAISKKHRAPALPE